MSILTARKALEILNIAETVISKWYGTTYEINFFFLDNPLQNMLRLVYEIL